jgi:hypothetical protein
MQPQGSENFNPVWAITPREGENTTTVGIGPSPLGAAAGQAVGIFHSGLPVVPAMPGALVRLELMLREPAPDLHALSELIRGDLGLTIQTLRLVGADFNRFVDSPCRIQDCIVHLGHSSLLLATPALKQSSLWGDRAALAELWKHSRLVGFWAEQIARSVRGVDTEKAYLAGLLHDIGSLPVLLGWRLPGVDYRDRVEMGCALAEAWQLPYFVTQGIRYRGRADGRPPLARLVAVAHQRIADGDSLP